MIGSDPLVLLGEPDEATSQLYQRALRGSFEVAVVHDAEGILGAIGARAPAAVVLELTLVAGRDWARLEAIALACAERGAALVICSTLDERRRGLDIGAAAYLVKPTLPATLLATLRQVLGAAPSGRQYSGFL